MRAELRVCAKISTELEALFEQIDPHPDPLPSDGRGNSLTHRLQFPKRLDPQSRWARFSLSHPMGEGRGEGEYLSISEVVFERILRCRSRSEEPLTKFGHVCYHNLPPSRAICSRREVRPVAQIVGYLDLNRTNSAQQQILACFAD